jgi:group I intron endonuclease
LKISRFFKKLILSREQYYLDLIFLCSEDKTNTFNILPTAGSRLESLHTEETKALISETIIGINYGKMHSTETKILMSKALFSENHSRGFLDKTHSSKTIAKISTNKKFYIYI